MPIAQHKSLLVIALVWPEPVSTAAGVRMLQILGVFQKQGYTITIASTASRSAFSLDVKALGMETQGIKLNDSSFDVFVKGLNPTVVLFDRFLTEEQFGWRVAENSPDALRILDTEDLHSLREVREQCFKKGVEFSVEQWLQHDKTKREIASIYRCDLSLIISSYEIELLTNVLNVDKRLLLLLPFMVAEISEKITWPTFERRNDFLFIGGGKHAPNIDAIHYLKSAIWPLVRQQLPEAQLNVYGAYLPQQVLEMHNPKQGFFVQGRAEDVQTVMLKTRVCLAPLRFGAGIKGKLLEAMRNGTPSITTTIGAEGMHGILKWNGTIVNDPVKFAKAAVHIYTHKIDWQNAQQNGITLVNTLYHKSTLGNLFLNQVEQLQIHLKMHRQQNFIGALLQHQTMTATKFMGKWIAEKNKKV